MGTIANECNLDVQNGELERALHRVVRAMHDGHCPSCGHLAPSYRFATAGDHKCPACGFFVTQEEADLALKMFHPFMKKSVDLFNEWRQKRTTGNVAGSPSLTENADSIDFSVRQLLPNCRVETRADGSLNVTNEDGTQLWLPGQ